MVKEPIDMLPEPTEKKTIQTLSETRKKFLEEISSNVTGNGINTEIKHKHKEKNIENNSDIEI